MEDGKFKVKVVADYVSGESFLAHRQLLLAMSSHGGRGEEALWGLF